MRRGRKLSAGAVIVAALLVAIWFWTSRDGPAKTPVRDLSVRDIPIAPEGSLEPMDATEPESAAAVGDTGLKTAPFVRPENVPPPVEAQGQDLLEILIVEKSSGLPWPGADVQWRRLDKTDWTTSDPDPDRDGWRVFERGATRARTNAAGVVKIPVDDSIVVRGRFGTLRGWQSFDDQSQSPTLLELEPDEFVTVRVSDAAGAVVAGVPLSIHLEAGPNGVVRGSEVRVRTDSSGLATVDLGMNRPPEILFMEAVVSVHSRILVPSDPHVEATVPLTVACARPIELSLSATGRVVVKIRESDGSVFVERAIASLGQRSTWSDGSPHRTTLLEWPPLRTETETGTAVFERVGLGIPLRIQVKAEGRDAVTVDAPALGGAGGETEIRVVLGDRCAVLTFRAVNQDGAALAFLKIRAIYDSADEDRWVTWCTTTAGTDGAGWFVLEINRPAFLGCGGAIRLEMLDGFGLVALVATVPLPGDLASGTLPARDLRFERPHVLVEGEVVDEEGRPLAGAVIKPMWWSPAGPIFPLRSGLQLPQSRSAPDGKFVLFGQDEARVRSIETSRRGFQTIQTVVTAGEPVRVAIARIP